MISSRNHVGVLLNRPPPSPANTNNHTDFFFNPVLAISPFLGFLKVSLAIGLIVRISIMGVGPR